MKLAKFLLFKIVSKMYSVLLSFGLPSFETPFSPLNIHVLPKGHNRGKFKETYDNYYSNNGEWNQDIELFNLIIELSKRFNSKPNLLDMGCGLGDLCFSLENTKLFSKITGIDISSVSIKKANEFNNSNKSSNSFFTSGIDKTNFSKASFSIITSIGAHEHLEIPDFREIKRLLSKDGICIMVLKIVQKNITKFLKVI
jgi:2-polyprenyl-3-methyl-5-hydroxy-6-metoxy-1,4-benzoquinol methylase